MVRRDLTLEISVPILAWDSALPGRTRFNFTDRDGVDNPRQGFESSVYLGAEFASVSLPYLEVGLG